MTPLPAWTEWLAEDAGCPADVLDPAAFEADAAEILERLNVCPK